MERVAATPARAGRLGAALALGLAALVAGLTGCRGRGDARTLAIGASDAGPSGARHRARLSGPGGQERPDRRRRGGAHGLLGRADSDPDAVLDEAAASATTSATSRPRSAAPRSRSTSCPRRSRRTTCAPPRWPRSAATARRRWPSRWRSPSTRTTRRPWPRRPTSTSTSLPAQAALETIAARAGVRAARQRAGRPAGAGWTASCARGWRCSRARRSTISASSDEALVRIDAALKLAPEMRGRPARARREPVQRCAGSATPRPPSPRCCASSRTTRTPTTTSASSYEREGPRGRGRARTSRAPGRWPRTTSRRRCCISPAEFRGRGRPRHRRPAAPTCAGRSSRGGAGGAPTCRRPEDLIAVDPPFAPTILGLYRGLPLGVETGPTSAAAHAASRSRRARSCCTARTWPARSGRRDELDQQIRRTLVHEIGHLQGLRRGRAAPPRPRVALAACRVDGRWQLI